jgi:hypothetical protein
MTTYWVERDGIEPEEFESYEAAVAYANQLADDLQADGWETDRSWASRRNMFAVRCTKDDLQIDIQVVDEGY